MSGMIAVADVHKSFQKPGGDLHILRGVNLDIYKGEMTALMGPSGVGKSTLLHILGTLDRPSSGEVFYNGRELFSLNDEELADFRNRTIGFVFQFHHLLPEFDSLENTIMPALIAGSNYQEARNRAERLLDEVGLSGRISHKPGELSGGEQQRVALARALMMEPEILLADEPTGNLDTRTGEALFNLLQEVNSKGITCVIVTHNEDLARKCRRVVRMQDGIIIQ